jgi:hypothetical protein
MFLIGENIVVARTAVLIKTASATGTISQFLYRYQELTLQPPTQHPHRHPQMVVDYQQELRLRSMLSYWWSSLLH